MATRTLMAPPFLCAGSAAGDVVAGSLLGQRRARGREPRDRQAERRAGHVVEAGLVAELDRAGVAAVLAADPDLQAGRHGAPASDSEPDQLAHALLVERLERVVRQEAALEVRGQELALGVVARQPERRLGEVVRAE